MVDIVTKSSGIFYKTKRERSSLMKELMPNETQAHAVSHTAILGYSNYRKGAWVKTSSRDLVGQSIRGLFTYSNSPKPLPVSPFAYDSKHFKDQAPSFGLNMAPQVFNKVWVALVAQLRIQEITLFPFLDDILVKEPIYQECLQDLQKSVNTQCEYGFIVNEAKSNMISGTKTHMPGRAW